MDTCRICGGTTHAIGAALILGRHEGVYKSCERCGFTFVENPFWLKEAYESAITKVDLGSVQRCEQYSRLLKTLIHLHSDAGGRFIDYGGGYGLLVRRMRDLGYDYHWYDEYCQNIFATGFEVERGACKDFSLLSAFEVFEHIVDPVTELQKMTEFSKHIIFSTELISRPAPQPGTWWYYAPEHGQHISFYTWDSLNRLARRLNLRFSTAGPIHMFSAKKVSPTLLRLACKPYASVLLNHVFRRPTLLERDFLEARSRLMELQSRDSTPFSGR